MKKFIFILIVAFVSLLAFYSSEKKEIVNSSKLKSYVEIFNKSDNELYTQHIPNENAFEFLNENIPLIDLPNKDLEETYYFRWWTFRKHIKSTIDGFVITEFLPEVSWSMKHNTINCPAGHHIYEGRWLKNSKYISEYIDFWLNKSGDGIRQYSFWIADAFLAFNKIHRNDSIIAKQLKPLINNYNEWEKIRKEKDKILFFQYDDRDGMELTVSGRKLNNGTEIFGIESVRPTINSYMYADAKAISKISYINNDIENGEKYEMKAIKIKKEIQRALWNEKLKFFTVLPKNYDETTNPLDVRELIGYVPWYFNLPDDEPKYAVAWNKIMDTTGFYAPIGLTVTEQSDPYFKISYEGHECQWNGPSWPFATTQTLKALANFLNNYSNNKTVTNNNYYDLLLQYSKQHKLKNNKGEIINWIDENINPFTGDWISRTRLKNWDNKGWSDEKGGIERGKDYNHSGFTDLILSDLIGIKPKLNNTIEIKPLVPDDWEWFAVDNIYYQDKKFSLIWDESGKKYGRGKGLTLFRDNILVANSSKIEKLTYSIK
tara:strand:- start:109 stop:1743 length:1635 start_codon:yes stop_codon:yes gene_type:complete